MAVGATLFASKNYWDFESGETFYTHIWAVDEMYSKKVSGEHN